MNAKHGMLTAAKEYDLTPLQATTIILIEADAPKPMKTFQKIYSCDASNVTGIIDGLESKDLVYRSEDSADRRIKVVVLTQQGKMLQEKLIAGFQRVDDEILGALSESELKLFQSLIIKLAAKS